MGDLGSIPGLGLENSMDYTVQGVLKNWTQLSNFLEKEMATHSSVLAWRIPGMGEPGGLLSMGSHRVGHDGSDLAAAAEQLSLSRLFKDKEI